MEKKAYETRTFGCVLLIVGIILMCVSWKAAAFCLLAACIANAVKFTVTDKRERE